MLKLVFHGGQCCGMKHIYGFFGSNPTSMQQPLDFEPHADEDQGGETVNSDLRAFPGPAPKETTAKRLDRYIEYLKAKRPSGIVEVTLGHWGLHEQKPVWHDELISRGFKLVNENYNSNSGNVFYVYHLNMNEGN